jgi:hypothetical protein
VQGDRGSGADDRRGLAGDAVVMSARARIGVGDADGEEADGGERAEPVDESSNPRTV